MTGRIRLYVGTYTRHAPFLKTANGKGIRIYDLNAATGQITFLNETQGIDNPSYLAIDSGNRFLYAVSEVAEWEEGTVSAYAIDHQGGTLRYINKQPTLGNSSCHISVDHADRYVMVANYGRGKSAAMYAVRGDGGLAPPECVVEHVGSGPIVERQEAPHAHCILSDPTNQFVFVADLGIDKLVGYQLDQAKGWLISRDISDVDFPPGSGPRHLLFHPNRKFAFVIQELSSTVVALTYDERNGTMQTSQIISTLPDGYTDASFCAAIQISPDGRFLYGSNRGHDSIVIYAIDDATGRLTCVGHQSTHGNIPRDFAIDPTGAFLLVGHQNSDSIVSFRINRGSGLLAETGYIADVPTPVCLKMIET